MHSRPLSTLAALVTAIGYFVGCSSSDPGGGSGGSTSTGGIGAKSAGGSTSTGGTGAAGGTGAGDSGSAATGGSIGGSSGSGATGGGDASLGGAGTGGVSGSGANGGAGGTIDASSETAGAGGTGGGDGSVDATDGGGMPPCGGPVLQGSFTIHNAIDAQTIANYAQITGALIIDTGPGFTSLSLPSLCSVGTDLQTGDAPDLAVVDLPSLTSVGAFSVSGAPVHTLNLGKLKQVTNVAYLETDGPLVLPVLESAGEVLIYSNPTQIDLPKLVSAGTGVVIFCDTACTATTNALTSAQAITLLNAKLTATKLTTLVDLFVNPGNADADLPELNSVTGKFWFKGDPGPKTFPKLAVVGGDFTLVTAAPSVSFPALTSIGGEVQIQGTATAQVVSFPMLGSLDGKTNPASIDLPGGVLSASAVATAKRGLVVRNVSSLDLKALQSVGPVGTVAPCGSPAWSNMFDLDGSTISTLQLPALTSACMLFGKPDTLCSSGNPSLSKIVAPNLTKGGVQFWNNPALPKCRADALAAQIPSPVPYGPYGGSSVFEHCPLASGPCP